MWGGVSWLVAPSSLFELRRDFVRPWLRGLFKLTILRWVYLGARKHEDKGVC